MPSVSANRHHYQHQAQSHERRRADSRASRHPHTNRGRAYSASSFTARARAYQQRLPNQPQLHRPHGKLTLLSLPLELRRNIWSLATCATSLLRVPPYFPTPEAYPGVLSVSRQVRREAAAQFYAGNKFSLIFGQPNGMDVFFTWLDKVGRANVGRLKQIVFIRRDCAFKIDLELFPSSFPGGSGAAKMQFMPMVPAAAAEEAKLFADLEPLLPKKGQGFAVDGLRKFFGMLHHRQWEKRGAQIVMPQLDGKDEGNDDEGDEGEGENYGKK